MNAQRYDLAAIRRLADIAGARLGPFRSAAPPEFETAVLDALEVAAWATNTSASTGDGSKTTIVMSRAMIDAALAQITAGADAAALCDGLGKAADAVGDSLKAQAAPVKTEEALTAAVIAAGVEPTLAQSLSQAAVFAGPKGALAASAAARPQTFVDFGRGLRFASGRASPYFLTQLDGGERNAGEAVLESPLVLLVDGEVSAAHGVVRPLELAAAARRSLLFVARTFTPEALAVLVLNKLAGAVRVCPVMDELAAVRGSDWSDRLADLAAVTGAKVLAPEALARVQTSDLGGAEQAHVGQNYTLVFRGQGSGADRDARLAALQQERERAGKQFTANFEKLVDREVALVRPAALIWFNPEQAIATGAWALAAVRSAVTDGVIPGGGAALAAAARALGRGPVDETLRAGLEAPCRHLARNAGLDERAVLASLAAAPAGHGLNAQTGAVEDLTAAGIVDLVATQCMALQQAAWLTELILADPAFLRANVAATAARPANPTGAPPRSPNAAPP